MLRLPSNLVRRLIDAGHSQFYCGAKPVCECKTPQTESVILPSRSILKLRAKVPAIRICALKHPSFTPMFLWVDRVPTWRKEPCNLWTTRLAQKCNLCVRNDLLPMCPGRTPGLRSGRWESNPRLNLGKADELGPFRL